MQKLQPPAIAAKISTIETLTIFLRFTLMPRSLATIFSIFSYFGGRVLRSRMSCWNRSRAAMIAFGVSIAPKPTIEGDSET